MKNRDTITNEIFNTNLKLITNRIEEILDLLENTKIMSYMSNSSKLFKLKNELNSIKDNIIKIFKDEVNEIKLTKFSMVVYHWVMNFNEYLKSNLKEGILIDNTNIKILNLDDRHMKKVNSYIKAFRLCIDDVNNQNII